MVIIREKNHRDYKSSGIICEINMAADGAKVRMRKNKEERQLLVVRSEICEAQARVCIS